MPASAGSQVREDRATQRHFWTEVGAGFPDLGGARSTRQYRENEIRLLREYLAPLEGRRLLKTDLWDEAKNTRILCWAASQGARVCGIDLSGPIVELAGQSFVDQGQHLHGLVSDVRALPISSASFDAIYSMGTIEHFGDSDLAVEEIFRVLKPGGRAIIGVPNRWDPFLRPLLVAFLYRLGLYGYGYEKSYSRRALREMLERAGFRVVAETGIMFVPGWLRMLDLACHCWARPMSRITGGAVAIFDHLSRRFSRLRRHGYLLATVVVRPP